MANKMKGNARIMEILIIIVIVLGLLYFIGFRLIYDPITGSINPALNPQNVFSWMQRWFGI